MFRLAFYRCNKWKVDARCRRGGENFLCFLCFLADALHRGRILAQINAFCAKELHHEIIRDTRIKIISTEMVVSGCSKHFDQVVTNLND